MLKRVLTFVPILVMLMFGACTGVPPEGIIPEGVGTLVAQTQTAIMWTPTVTPTPDPDTAQIVDILNSGIITADSLRYTVVARFNVLDVHFPMDDVAHQILAMQIDIDCNWVYTDSCTPEETFASLMHGFVASDKAMDKIKAAGPSHSQECVCHCL